MNLTDRLYRALAVLVAQHDRPHGFSDEHWYREALETARAALADAFVEMNSSDNATDSGSPQ
jgi:hypothetical protein